MISNVNYEQCGISRLAILKAMMLCDWWLCSGDCGHYSTQESDMCRFWMASLLPFVVLCWISFWIPCHCLFMSAFIYMNSGIFFFFYIESTKIHIVMWEQYSIYDSVSPILLQKRFDLLVAMSSKSEHRMLNWWTSFTCATHSNRHCPKIRIVL